MSTDTANPCTDNGGNTVRAVCLLVYGSGTHVDSIGVRIFIPPGQSATGKFRVTKNGTLFLLEGTAHTYNTNGQGRWTQYHTWNNSNNGWDFNDGDKLCGSFLLTADDSLWDGVACCTIQATGGYDEG